MLVFTQVTCALNLKYPPHFDAHIVMPIISVFYIKGFFLVNLALLQKGVLVFFSLVLKTKELEWWYEPTYFVVLLASPFQSCICLCAFLTPKLEVNARYLLQENSLPLVPMVVLSLIAAGVFSTYLSQ